MLKYFFTISVATFLLASPCVLADTNSANPPAAGATTTPQSAPDGILITVGDNFSVPITKDILDSWIKHENTFSLSPILSNEFANTSYCPISKIFCALTLTSEEKQRLNLSSKTTIDTKTMQTFLDDLATKVNTVPEDPKFQVVNGIVTTFQQAAPGITLDVQKSIQTLTDAIKSGTVGSGQKIALPFDASTPTTNYGDVNNMGISSLLGEGTSNFKGSPANRVHNITVGAAKFNGLLIKPGEEFSFIQNLGEVDASTGYLPELVIKGNETEPEFGGGICQVSTTAFRAALYSGLKITDRRNHAYAVSYYNPQGMDATVYIPNPDLKFINNTPNNILIQTKIVGTILTFDFYGTDDGRKTTIDGPYITDRQADGSMKAHFTQLVVDKDGNQVINEVFNSSYNSPYLYPHPGAVPLAVKPANWTNDQWKAYLKQNG